METGQATDSSISFLAEILNNNPAMAPSAIKELNKILLKEDKKSYNSVMSAFSMAAERDPELITDSIDVIVDCMKKGRNDFHEDWKLKSLEVLLKVNYSYPERMGNVVPELFICLGNASPIIREKAYFLLSLLAATHPEFFKDSSKDLIRVLNGLYDDERIYACRLAKRIADRDPKIVEDTYSVLEDLRLNHPHSNLRSEAAHAVEKLKEAAEQKPPQADAGINDSSSSELVDLMTPDVEDLKNTLKKWGLNHLIADKGTVKGTSETDSEDSSMLNTALKQMKPSRVIEAVLIVDSTGRVLARSGIPIDESLVSKLISMISSENNAEFRSRVSLEHADKKIVAVRVGKTAIMVAMTGANIPIGIVLMEMNKSAEKIDRLLEG